MDEIPPELRPPLITEQAVLDRLDEVVDADSRARSSLWVLFLDADAWQLPIITAIDDVSPEPDGLLLSNLFVVIREVLAGHAPGGSVVLALTGPERLDEQGWADALESAAEQSRVRVRMRCAAGVDGARPMQASRAA